MIDIEKFWNCFGWHEEYFEDEPETVWAIFDPEGNLTIEGYPLLDMNSIDKWVFNSPKFGEMPEIGLCKLANGWWNFDVEINGLSYNADAETIPKAVYEAIRPLWEAKDATE